MKPFTALCCLFLAFLLAGLSHQVRMQKSLDFIRNELAKNENLKKAQLKRYVRQVTPAYIVKKGDRSLEGMTLSNIRNNRFEFHRYLAQNKFHKFIDPDMPNWQITMLSFLFVLFLTILMILCSSLRRSLLKSVKHNVSRRINEISKDLLILVLASGILKLIDYFDFIPWHLLVALINDVQLLASMFCIVYIVVNVVCIIYAQKHIARWLDYESYVPDRVEIYREFERLYIDNLDGVLDDEAKPKYEKFKKVLKFISLRQEFISPTFVPLFRESVLRDDFRFGEYLGKAYYKTLRKVVSLRKFSLMAFLVMFVLYIVLRIICPEDFEVYAMMIFSIVFFFLMVTLKIGSQNIFYRLSRPLKSPYEFSVQPFDAVRNPYANLDKILTPFYLRSNFTNTYVSSTRLITPHESLFLFSSPELCLRLLHLVLFVQILWQIIFYTNYAYELTSALPIVAAIISSLAAFFSVFFYFPVAVRNFVLTCNIEMMKDQRLIEECVAEQKESVAEAFGQLYSTLKQMKRERFNDENEALTVPNNNNNKAINLVIVACRAAYEKLKEEKGIASEKLEDFCRLVGSQLNQQEMFYFIRKCFYDNEMLDTQKNQEKVAIKDMTGDIKESKRSEESSSLEVSYKDLGSGGKDAPSFISFYRLMEAIDDFKEESNYDPAALCYLVLSKSFCSSSSSSALSVSQLENFMRALKHLKHADTETISNEIRYLQSIKNINDCEDIALLVRDSIERHAK